MLSEITLREFLEEKLASLSRETSKNFELVGKGFELMNGRIDARDHALKIQTEANRVHFDALNHEAARIQAAADKSVSRDTWDEYLKNDQEWKSKFDQQFPALLTKAEFQTYKETSDKALQLKAGQSQGVGMTGAFVVQVISTISSLAVLISVIFLLFHKGG